MYKIISNVNVTISLALILFLLLSCSVAESTSPGGTSPGGSTSEYMSFALSDGNDASVDLSTELSRDSSYKLVISQKNDSPFLTANYDIKAAPPDAITINVQHTNSINFTVNNTDVRVVTITATHKGNSVISNALVLRLAPLVVTSFQEDIEYTVTVPNFTTAKSSLTREVLEPLNANAGATLEKRYATESGGGSRNGSTWANAWAAVNLRDNINAISDASANKVYLVMIAGGTYKPDYSNPANREISFSMKNHVAIIGGFQAGGGWEHTGTTFMSGDIGTAGSTNDNSYHVFYHSGLILDNAHLYGVTITNGNANSGTSAQKRGGGMDNGGSSPNLTRVIFSGNSATRGGGIFNEASSSPVLNQVTFSGNSATRGGGMYNSFSSPVLNQVVFSGNNASSGGGMYNDDSSPNLNQVVFSGNSAAQDGGGMANSRISSPVLNQVVFSGNSATRGGGMYNDWSSPAIVGTVFTGNSAVNGGGMYNNNDGRVGPRILNTIFVGNTTNSGIGAGPDIAMDFGGSGVENITIAGSVLGIYLTTGTPTNAIVGYGRRGIININYHHLTNLSVNLTGTGTLTVNGMDFTYPTITTGSSAMNLGLYVRKSGPTYYTTYYFSADKNTWYTGFTTTGNFPGDSVDLPANTEDLTATDITGKARTGRPDAGVNEL